MISDVHTIKDEPKPVANELDDSFKSARVNIRRFAAVALISLTIFSISAISWTYYREQTLVEGLATKEAKANFNKDLSFRKWATKHGGVYVPPDERTPPNPALAHLPHRDLVTKDGKKLTLMNPAYMMRQMTEEFEQFYGVKGSITGLVLLNPPINSPDKWEREVLNRFEFDSSEVIEIIDIDGAPFLRLMRPMFMTEGCVKCHGFLGYKDGDLRGGISVSIPLAPYFEEARNVSMIMAITISVLWCVGVFGIFRHTKSRLAQVDMATQHTGELRAEIATRIEAEKALKTSEERFILATTGSSDGLWDWLDITGDAKWWSSHFYELLGYKEDEVNASFSKFIEFIHQEDQEHAFQGIKNHLEKDIPFDVEFRMCTKSGEYLWFRCRGQAIRNEKGRAVRLSGSIQNINDKKLAQDKVIKLTQELEQRVKERTMELEASNKELESFSYTVSHDLRTPLRVIDGNSEILMQLCAEKLSDDEMEFLKHLQDSGRKMNEMISGLLKLSRNINCEMERQQMDLSLLAQEVYQQFSMADPERDVEWVVEKNISAKCDPALIKVVLENLIGNAWKYSAKTDNARIEFGVQHKDDQEVFYVKDNGVGCDMAQAEKLFQPFKRLHTSEDFSGDGIGLATVQRIIHRHGGRVWAESEIGKGTTLFFTL
ncbi:MAG: DUF3365 domain-containing protein [Magnetococcales bacterium]|nr:DUF3365 domain-containing protein [Magnetococcales bacterium]